MGFIAWQLHRICDTLFSTPIMDEYHYYIHRSPNDGKDKEEKQIEIKTKTKNKTEGAELLKFTKSTQNELCFMEKDILNCLHKLDENKQKHRILIITKSQKRNKYMAKMESTLKY